MSSNKLIKAVGENYRFAKTFYFEMVYGEGRMPTPDGMAFLKSSKVSIADIDDEDNKKECAAVMACMMCDVIKTGSRVFEAKEDDLIEAVEQFKAAMELELMAKAGLCTLGEKRDEDGWPIISVNEEQAEAIKILVERQKEQNHDV